MCAAAGAARSPQHARRSSRSDISPINQHSRHPCQAPTLPNSLINSKQKPKHFIPQPQPPSPTRSPHRVLPAARTRQLWRSSSHHVWERARQGQEGSAGGRGGATRAGGGRMGTVRQSRLQEMAQVAAWVKAAAGRRGMVGSRVASGFCSSDLGLAAGIPALELLCAISLLLGAT